MKIGIIVPTRNNRPDFLANCRRMIMAQTITPDVLTIVDDSPNSELCDITYRYRIGYDRLRGLGLDAIFFMEDDDWYSPDYIETMLYNWIKHGQPDLFGPNYTIYYHLYLNKYFKFDHDDRSSMMSTLMKPDLDFPWCADDEPYTDMFLWLVLKDRFSKVTFDPGKHICIGIKHGIGKVGGHFHNSRVHRFNKDDLDLNQVMDPASADFYTNYFARRPDQAEFVKNEITRHFNKY